MSQVTLNGEPLTGAQGFTFKAGDVLVGELDIHPVTLPPMEPVTVTGIYTDQAYQDALDAFMGIPNLREVWFYPTTRLFGLISIGIHFQAEPKADGNAVSLAPRGPVRRCIRVWRWQRAFGAPIDTAGAP
jgi:hypothetical protein